MRKLTGVHLARDADERRTLLQDLGPDALSVRDDELTRILGGRSRQLKAALMDQHVLAGLGNLLVDEILWQARLHPRAPTAQLDNAQLTGLAGSLRKVLRAERGWAESRTGLIGSPASERSPTRAARVRAPPC